MLKPRLCIVLFAKWEHAVGWVQRLESCLSAKTFASEACNVEGEVEKSTSSYLEIHTHFHRHVEFVTNCWFFFINVTMIIYSQTLHRCTYGISAHVDKFSTHCIALIFHPVDKGNQTLTWNCLYCLEPTYFMICLTSFWKWYEFAERHLLNVFWVYQQSKRYMCIN